MADLNSLIKEGEGVNLEYKLKISSPKKIAKLLTAFANSRGGKILIGVDDQGKICGLKNHRLQKACLRFAAKEYCDPPLFPSIETLTHDGKKILLVSIHKSRFKPHHWITPQGKKHIYLRSNDKNIIASKLTLQDLQKRTKTNSKVIWKRDSKENFVLSYLKEKERITLNKLCMLLNISRRRALRILVSLRKEGKIYLHSTGREEFYTLA